jgi:hypothetical protein
MQRPPEPTAPPPPSAPGCTARECSASLGEPARCGPDGACSRLTAEGCELEASAQAIEDDRTVWIGAMFPADHADASVADFGQASLRAVSLAVQEIQSVSGGIPSPAGQRPIGVVACKDGRDPSRVARHLVEEVQAPAIVGFGSSQSLVELSSSLFIPRDVLAVAAANSSALLSGIPHPAGSPRLVFRTAANTDSRAAAIARLLESELEPRLRRRAGRAPKDPIRVALITRGTSAGLALSSALSRSLRLDGKPVAEAADSWLELRLLADDAAPRTDRVVADLVDFAPDLILVQDPSDVVTGRVLAPLEDRWLATKARPHYLVASSLEQEALRELLLHHPTIERRMLGLTPGAHGPATSAFTRAYNASFHTSYSDVEAPSAPYDSIYLLAYALAADAASVPTGASLSSAIARLAPPGRALDVGPASLLDAFSTLARGENVDPTGAFSLLDFDPATGETPTRYSVVCIRRDPNVRAPDTDDLRFVESKLTYDPRSATMQGTWGACEPDGS